MKKENKAPETVEQKNETALTVVSKNEKVEAKNEQPTFMTVVKNVREETQLLGQWQRLDEKEKELDAFNFSSDNVHDDLTIVDNEGHEFSTNNTFLITQVTEMLKGLIADKKVEIENELTRRRLAA